LGALPHLFVTTTSLTGREQIPVNEMSQ